MLEGLILTYEQAKIEVECTHPPKQAVGNVERRSGLLSYKISALGKH